MKKIKLQPQFLDLQQERKKTNDYSTHQTRRHNSLYPIPMYRQYAYGKAHRTSRYRS